jgi:hypothetical protein
MLLIMSIQIFVLACFLCSFVSVTVSLKSFGYQDSIDLVRKMMTNFVGFGVDIVLMLLKQLRPLMYP